MKTFRYEPGHVAKQTMTVAELIEILHMYPADMPVMMEHEGSHVALMADRLRVERDYHYGKKDDACDTLILED